VLFAIELQVSLVQLSPSSQFGALPGVQVPLWQLSFCVQPLESALQLVPPALLLNAVLDDALVHCWHWLPGFIAPSA
jgi:hypothetical protein